MFNAPLADFDANLASAGRGWCFKAPSIAELAEMTGLKALPDTVRYDSYVAAADPRLLQKTRRSSSPLRTTRPPTMPSSTTRAPSTSARAPMSSAARWTLTPIPSPAFTSPAWRTEACSARPTTLWAAPALACPNPRDAWPPRRWSSISPTLKRSYLRSRHCAHVRAKRIPPFFLERPSPGRSFHHPHSTRQRPVLLDPSRFNLPSRLSASTSRLMVAALTPRRLLAWRIEPDGSSSNMRSNSTRLSSAPILSRTEASAPFATDKSLSSLQLKEAAPPSRTKPRGASGSLLFILAGRKWSPRNRAAPHPSQTGSGEPLFRNAASIFLMPVLRPSVRQLLQVLAHPPVPVPPTHRAEPP